MDGTEPIRRHRRQRAAESQIGEDLAAVLEVPLKAVDGGRAVIGDKGYGSKAVRT